MVQRNKLEKMKRKSKKETWRELRMNLKDDPQENKKCIFEIAEALHKSKSSINVIKDDGDRIVTRLAKIIEKWKNILNILVNIETKAGYEQHWAERTCQMYGKN